MSAIEIYIVKLKHRNMKIYLISKIKQNIMAMIIMKIFILAKFWMKKHLQKYLVLVVMNQLLQNAAIRALILKSLKTIYIIFYMFQIIHLEEEYFIIY